MSNDYKDNEVAPNAKYKGKTLELSGTILSIQAGISDKAFLTLATGERLSLNQPHAEMAESEQLAIANLKKGQAVKLRCIGNSEIAGNAMLKDCTLL